MAKALEWYGVKTLYRSAAVGPRRGIDSFFSDQVTLVEERVVVVRARSADEAIRKGEKEATTYARDWHRNPYGQRVRTRYLGYVDAFTIEGRLQDGAEVFSETEVVRRSVSDRSLVQRLVGRPESKRVFRSRRNVLDILFNAPAPGVKRTAHERAQIAKMMRLAGRRDA